MAEETSTPLTAAQIKQAADIQAAKDRAAAIEARANQVKQMIGKAYKPKVPNLKLPDQYFLATRYLGVVTNQRAENPSYHAVLLETREPAEYLLTKSAYDIEQDFVEYTIPTAKPEPKTV